MPLSSIITSQCKQKYISNGKRHRVHRCYGIKGTTQEKVNGTMHSKICCTFTYQTEISHGTLCEKRNCLTLLEMAILNVISITCAWSERHIQRVTMGSFSCDFCWNYKCLSTWKVINQNTSLFERAPICL
jgi:hypothetical protein